MADALSVGCSARSRFTLASRLVVVANLDVIRIAVDEPEADAPLSVHRDGVLPQSVILERIQAIARRHLQVIHADLQVDVFQLANGAPGDVGLDSVWLSPS